MLAQVRNDMEMPMSTAFDFLTVACFVGLVIAFFRLTDRDARTLMQLMIPAAAFAIANQMGNAGLTIFALILVVAGAGYAALVVKGSF
jgi:predicted branched-subunit amino acid permease